MSFEFENTKISGVILVKPKVFEDSRGFFLETYQKNEFKKGGIEEEFVQENHSKSKKGSFEGFIFKKENMHKQNSYDA